MLVRSEWAVLNLNVYKNQIEKTYGLVFHKLLRNQILILQKCLLKVNKKNLRVPCWDKLFQMIPENLKLLGRESFLIK